MAGYSLTLLNKIEHFLYDDDVTDIYLNQDRYIRIKTVKGKYKTDIIRLNLGTEKKELYRVS